MVSNQKQSYSLLCGLGPGIFKYGYQKKVSRCNEGAGEIPSYPESNEMSAKSLRQERRQNAAVILHSSLKRQREQVINYNGPQALDRSVLVRNHTSGFSTNIDPLCSYLPILKKHRSDILQLQTSSSITVKTLVLYFPLMTAPLVNNKLLPYG